MEEGISQPTPDRRTPGGVLPELPIVQAKMPDRQGEPELPPKDAKAPRQYKVIPNLEALLAEAS